MIRGAVHEKILYIGDVRTLRFYVGRVIEKRSCTFIRKGLVDMSLLQWHSLINS